MPYSARTTSLNNDVLKVGEPAIIVDATVASFALLLQPAAAGQRQHFIAGVAAGGRFCAVTCAGADTIDGAASVGIGDKQSIILLSDGVATWRCLGRLNSSP